MTTATMALIEYLRKAELELEDDWLRQMVQSFTQGLIELEGEQKIGAGRHERSPNRLTQRNGYRDRGLATRVGELELQIPKLRQGAFSPACWNRAGGRRKRWWQWCRKHMSKG